VTKDVVMVKYSIDLWFLCNFVVVWQSGLKNLSQFIHASR